jgi:hypothetical protein
VLPGLFPVSAIEDCDAFPISTGAATRPDLDVYLVLLSRLASLNGLSQIIGHS